MTIGDLSGGGSEWLPRVRAVSADVFFPQPSMAAGPHAAELRYLTATYSML